MFPHENIIYIGWYFQMKAIYKMSLLAAEILVELHYCQLEERKINQIISELQDLQCSILENVTNYQQVLF